METLKLKSKVISMKDYHEIDIQEFAIPLEVDERKYQRDMQNFRKRFATVVEADEVADQDNVTLSCCGASSRFNKQHVTVRVGIGLFSKDLEQQMIGMSVGETKKFIVKEEEVTVTVEKISRQLLPELTDELVKQAGIEGVETVEDAQFWCKGHQFDEELENQADEVFAYVAGKVMEDSQFELDAEELEASYQSVSKILKGCSALEGKSIDELTEEEFEETFYMPRSGMEAHLRMTAEGSLKAATIGAVLMEQAGKVVTEEQYEQDILRRMDGTDRSEEEIRKENTLTMFMIDSYNGYYLDTLEAYAMRKLKEVCL